MRERFWRGKNIVGSCSLGRLGRGIKEYIKFFVSVRGEVQGSLLFFPPWL
jgi:hypothetical protein